MGVEEEAEVTMGTEGAETTDLEGSEHPMMVSISMATDNFLMKNAPGTSGKGDASPAIRPDTLQINVPIGRTEALLGEGLTGLARLGP